MVTSIFPADTANVLNDYDRLPDTVNLPEGIGESFWSGYKGSAYMWQPHFFQMKINKKDVERRQKLKELFEKPENKNALYDEDFLRMFNDYIADPRPWPIETKKPETFWEKVTSPIKFRDERIHNFLVKMAAKFPGEIRTDEEIVQESISEIHQFLQKDERVGEGLGEWRSFMHGLGALAGAIHPVAMFGGISAIAAGRGLLARTLIGAGEGAGIEAAMTPMLSDYRETTKLEFPTSDKILNIAFGALGGAAPPILHWGGRNAFRVVKRWAHPESVATDALRDRVIALVEKHPELMDGDGLGNKRIDAMQTGEQHSHYMSENPGIPSAKNDAAHLKKGSKAADDFNHYKTPDVSPHEIPANQIRSELKPDAKTEKEIREFVEAQRNRGLDPSIAPKGDPALDDSLLDFIAKLKGIATRSAGKYTDDLQQFVLTGGEAGNKILAGTESKSIGEVAQLAKEAGYLERGTADELIGKINQEVKGEPVYSTKGTKLQAAPTEEQRALQNIARPTDAFTEAELDRRVAEILDKGDVTFTEDIKLPDIEAELEKFRSGREAIKSVKEDVDVAESILKCLMKGGK